MKRSDLINEILDKSSEEFNTKDNYIELAKETKHQLVIRIIHINQWIFDNK